MRENLLADVGAGGFPVDGESRSAVPWANRKERDGMKVTEKSDDTRIKAVISFVHGVARRLGDRESLAAAQRVEIALKAMARPLAGRVQAVRQTGNACVGD